MDQILNQNKAKALPNDFNLDKFLTLQTLFIVLPILIVVFYFNLYIRKMLSICKFFVG